MVRKDTCGKKDEKGINSSRNSCKQTPPAIHANKLRIQLISSTKWLHNVNQIDTTKVGEQIQQVNCVMKFAQFSFLYIICVFKSG